MKDSVSTAITVAALAFLAVRLYQKYIKKDKNQQGGPGKQGSSFSSGPKDDDYEPYSEK